jgi:AraC-like DNA-binding protein
MTATSTVISYLATCDLSRVQGNDAAHALKMCQGNMRRVLRIEGTKFSALLDAERRRRCNDLLTANPHLDGPLLARKTGYNETNSALRSFKGWYGVSLQEFKRGQTLSGANGVQQNVEQKSNSDYRRRRA